MMKYGIRIVVCRNASFISGRIPHLENANTFINYFFNHFNTFIAFLLKQKHIKAEETLPVAQMFTMQVHVDNGVQGQSFFNFMLKLEHIRSYMQN